MSVDAGTETDIWALVGDLPAQPCESVNHGHPILGDNHDDGPATHYLQMMHECSWMGKGEIYAGCAKTAARAAYNSGRKISCRDCGTKGLVYGGWIRVVGPIEG